MCGRYALYGPQSRLKEQFSVEDWPDFSERYNIAPSAEVPVVRCSPTGERVVHLLRWGLVPHWAKDPAIGAKLNNARAETVADKPSFRSAYQRRRCLIPASGYYEWQALAGERHKQPWYISARDGNALALGGLWESWTDPAGQVVRTVCVITTGPNELMQPIHERMPVIVSASHWQEWLDPSRSPDALQRLLVPCPSDILGAWKVSRRVSNARVDEPTLVCAESVE